MNYTPEQLADLHAAIDAHSKGLPTQFSSSENYWIDVESQQQWLIGKSLFRPKPEPKLRPWRESEVPVGKVIVFKEAANSSGRFLITAAVGSAIYFGHSSAITAQLALIKCTMADGSPCGVIEP